MNGFEPSLRQEKCERCHVTGPCFTVLCSWKYQAEYQNGVKAVCMTCLDGDIRQLQSLDYQWVKEFAHEAKGYAEKAEASARKADAAQRNAKMFLEEFKQRGGKKK